MKWRLTTVLLSVLLTEASVFAAAGRIVSVTGPTQITRSENYIKGGVDVSVEILDIVETLEARTAIQFEDDTNVRITEHSKLKIDDFVYNPATGKGKIGLKAALGTVRYASGRIGHNSRENVNIQTPTASVAVRGTDFSMTVDEIGRSLVILLPSKLPSGLLLVGVIDVTTMGGTVTMDKAFQGTFVASSFAAPTPPVIFDLDEGGIGNDMLLTEPTPIGGGDSSATGRNDNQGNEALAPLQYVSGEERVIQIIDNSRFVFVENGGFSTLDNRINGNVISIKVPATSGATLSYEYAGGKAQAQSGTGVGVNITIIQK
jgi:hypothetical protein